jgi:hypothetical protein
LSWKSIGHITEGSTESEIDDFAIVMFVNQYILTFDITISDMASIVQIFNGCNDLHNIFSGKIFRSSLTLVDTLTKVVSLAKFLDNVIIIIIFDDGKKFDDEGTIGPLM